MVSIGAIIWKAARWVGLAVLFVVTLEVCARIDDWLTWGAPPWGHYSHALLLTIDELGPHCRFGARFERWRVNSHGFRGPETTMQKPEKVTRIIVIGASETFGLYESPEKEFPAQLGQMLELAEPGRYEVLNAGCAGMTQPRFIHYYRVWLTKFKPDIVIYYPTPASYLWTIPPTTDLVTRKGPPARLPETIRLKRKTKTALLGFLPVALKRHGRELRARRRHRKHLRKVGWVWEETPPERIALFEEHLTALVEEITGSGARMILGTHAHRFPEKRDAWTATDETLMAAWRRHHPATTERILLEMEDGTNEAVRRLGGRLGVPVIDLAADVPRKGTHFADFSHFTDRGAEIVARKIAQKILADGAR